MNFLYNTGIRLYAGALRAAGALGHHKALLMTRGHRRVFDALKDFNIEASGNVPRVWIHAASLGEFEQGRPLIEALRRAYPDVRILLSFFSPSGYEVRKNYEGADCVVYLPFDTPAAARRFVDIARPDVAIFVKYEFWGNYLQALYREGVPTYLISAIFRKEQIFFRPWGSTFRRMLLYFKKMFVQDEASVALLESAGVDKTDIVVAGDTRLDRVTATRDAARAIPEIERWLDASGGSDRFTFIAGSSWEPDEDIFIPWLDAHPEVRAIIAPHEFNAERLRVLVDRLGGPERAILHSRMADATPEALAQARVVIIDCFGLLSSLYRYGSIAYIGGGFGAGIHSVAEAAVFAIPVVFGPKYHKFREARELIACGGAFAIDSPKSFATIASRFLHQPAALAQAGQAAGEYIDRNTGATEIIVKEILEHI